MAGRRPRSGYGRDQARAQLLDAYKATGPDYSLRAFLPQVQQAQKSASAVMIDVRSPQEFTGEILAPPGLPETCQRGGHIPGARSVPWGKACNDDGTFKSADELEKLYGAEGVVQSKPVIAYCRIGERSSHTWFVLKYLLGVNNVINYDGSWTEWGNLVGAPVEKGAANRSGKREAGKLQRAPSGRRRLAGESHHLQTGRQVAHQGRQCVAWRCAGAYCRRHARRRRNSRSGAGERASRSNQAPLGLAGFAC